ncbi:hypothetical protein BDV96DRAFT_606885 [Lophiotrema nucula]|uniref:Uncharacterized protein n=1 Tax=Lophiotrema nucula TaxID=690887 RepID=A0A6A5YIL8_9PLEO|nr:hypothetical protein BDV96DRAFT_606885 [Lophiotrema nucula]
MAEPVSAIVSLVTVSLEIIKKVAKFIREAKVIDKTIESLLVQLRDFKGLIKIVSSTCRESPLRQTSEPHRLITSYLERSQLRLQVVESDLKALALRPSRTFFHKVTLTIQTKHWRTRIDESIKDLERLSGLMHRAVSLWTLQVTHEIHRNSRAVPAEEAIVTRAELLRELQQLDQTEENAAISPISRTDSSFSQTETIVEPPSRRASSNAQDPRASFSSSSTSSRSRRPQSGRNDSVISEEQPAKPSNDWVDFHFKIVERHDSSEAQFRAIRDALQQHPNSSYLANSKDGSKRSPLHWAAQRGDTKLAQILVDFGADVNAKDSQPCSVLDLAVAHNHEAFVGFLIRNGVNESAVSKQNQFRFDEMKEAIDLRRSMRT